MAITTELESTVVSYSLMSYLQTSIDITSIEIVFKEPGNIIGVLCNRKMH